MTCRAPWSLLADGVLRTWREYPQGKEEDIGCGNVVVLVYNFNKRVLTL